MQNTIEIIVIEDEEDILELIEYHLSSEGYEVTGFLSTENVEQFLEEETPSLMIVDRNLPGMEGSEFVTYLRDVGYSIPVIFLTAKDKESELEEGFDAGADDYITKPFRPVELKLRVKALLKRYGVLNKQKRLKYKQLTIDLLFFAIDENQVCKFWEACLQDQCISGQDAYLRRAHRVDHHSDILLLGSLDTSYL